MAIYLVTGKLGSGKSLASVGRIRDALLAGRPVATNLDLVLDRMLSANAGKPRPDGVQPVRAYRLPDKPAVADLDALGLGNQTMDENQNGLIVLDELAAWLNAREWANKERQQVIDWLLHSRKKGWDVVFIAQHLDQIDKQVRVALVEYLVVCRRLDRMRIPFVGGLIKFLSGGWLKGQMPKLHVATVRYGVHPDAPVADRWLYLAKDLYDAYDTRQVFTDHYANGIYSYLPPWHTKGRYAVKEPQPWWLFTLEALLWVPVLPFLLLLEVCRPVRAEV